MWKDSYLSDPAAWRVYKLKFRLNAEWSNHGGTYESTLSVQTRSGLVLLAPPSPLCLRPNCSVTSCSLFVPQREQLSDPPIPILRRSPCLTGSPRLSLQCREQVSAADTCSRRIRAQEGVCWKSLSRGSINCVL